MRKKILIPAALLICFQLFSFDSKAISPHWADEYISKAISKAWVDTPRSEFMPEQVTTRAEFLKILEKAVGLTPGSNSDKLYAQASPVSIPFTDTASHWVFTGGWLKTALNFGLVIHSDYQDNKFGPDLPITRRESIVMITRALGRVYPATQNTLGNAQFIDWNLIPSWANGYVRDMSDHRIVIGYPDGFVRVESNLTNAEAVTLICRAWDEMVQGVDPNIKVFISNSYPKDNALYKIQQIDLPVPAQIIKGKLYLPLRAIYNNGYMLYFSSYSHDLNSGYRWYPQSQVLSFEYGVLHQFQAGNALMGFQANPLPFTGKFIDPGNLLASEVRILYGELIVPLIDNGKPAQLRKTYNNTWDAGTKTLSITIGYPDHPSS